MRLQLSFSEITRHINVLPPRLSGGILLPLPTFRTKVTLGDRSFQVAVPKLWNALPRELCDILYLHTFKHHLKMYLFKFVYSEMNFN